ncbi:hypothetical protein CPB86DRAFT_812602 [Serendipita vermifera]|nr:hypothetical protein CPB86DRAFT_812602 [Serendipita vermifera]
MPFIEEIDDNEQDTAKELERLDDLLKQLAISLKIPEGFKNPDWAVDSNGSALISWRNSSSALMLRLLSSVQSTDSSEVEKHFVSIVQIAVPFIGAGSWVNSETREHAKNILSLLGKPTIPQVRSVLTECVRPAFEKASPNERLNPTTGTKVKRNINPEPMYHDDADDVWKREQGLPDIILWSLMAIEDRDWDIIWPLLLPPILTYLDDWEAIYRLHGIALARKLVERAPKDLLARTGVNQLIKSSFDTSLLRLTDNLSPQIFKQSALASMELVIRMTEDGSMERYQGLFTLLGDGIISGAWMFGYRDSLLIQATYDVLTPLLEQLGVACVRYLKAMIPQLLHTLNASTELKNDVSMQESSLRALRNVIRYGAPRIAFWSGEIVGGVAKAWTLLAEEKSETKVKHMLKSVIQDLMGNCPVETRKYLEQLKSLDEELFTPLVIPED